MMIINAEKNIAKSEKFVEENKLLKTEIILTKDELKKSYVRSNPVIIRLSENRIEEFGIDITKYLKEPSEEKAEKLIEDLQQKHPELNLHRLKDISFDLIEKQKQYYSSVDSFFDRMSKFLMNKIDLEGRPVFVEGKGWCELKEMDKKILLKEIEEEIFDYPLYIVMSPEILESEILPIVSEVTGVKYEQLSKDAQKIRFCSPRDVVEYKYDLGKQQRGVALGGIYAKSQYLGNLYSVGIPIHEITHLEDVKLQKGNKTLDFLLTEAEERSPKEYMEGVAVIAEINGLKQLADKRKDIGIQLAADSLSACMTEVGISEYLEKNGVSQREIIKTLKELGVNFGSMEYIFGNDWQDGKIDSEKFKTQKKYFGRAYEIAKYFGENAQVLKISPDEWGEFLKIKEDWQKLNRYKLEADVLDHRLDNLGGEPGIGLSAKTWLDFFRRKKGCLRIEMELLNSKDEEICGKVEKKLKQMNISRKKRLKIIEKEISQVETKIQKILKRDFKDIKVEDLF